MSEEGREAPHAFPHSAQESPIHDAQPADEQPAKRQRMRGSTHTVPFSMHPLSQGSASAPVQPSIQQLAGYQARQQPQLSPTDSTVSLQHRHPHQQSQQQQQPSSPPQHLLAQQPPGGQLSVQQQAAEQRQRRQGTTGSIAPPACGGPATGGFPGLGPFPGLSAAVPQGPFSARVALLQPTDLSLLPVPLPLALLLLHHLSARQLPTLALVDPAGAAVVLPVLCAA